MTILPLLVSFLLLVSKSDEEIKETSLITTIILFFMGMYLLVEYDCSTVYFQYFFQFNWIDSIQLNFSQGVDGTSIFFVVLTTYLIPFCLMISWAAKPNRLKEYTIAFLILESLLILVFTVLDLLLFYVFFESVLIPMFLIIGIWGSRERKIHAAYQFFLYTFLGSVFMLLGILIIYLNVGTTDVQILLSTVFSNELQIILWLTFFASFAVKVPMVPFHIWLPEAHVEAPTAGSVLLAGILLKLGTYGFLRFSLPLFPYASVYFTPLVFTMSVIAIIYTSLTTIRQIDLKKIIAYASVGHMNFVTIGLFSFNLQAIEGSLLVMLSHGLVSSALFICVGILYDRYKTRIIKYYRGLTVTMPIFAVFFMFLTLANISFPGTFSFVGEFLILLGAFQENTTVTLLASTGMILGTAYSIWLYNRISFGSITASLNYFNDITAREFYILIPFVILIVVFGIYPDIILQVFETKLTVSPLLK